MVIKQNLSIISQLAPVEVRWIGSSLDYNSLIIPEHLKFKSDVYFYQKCIIDSFTVKIGDFVLVQNADAAEPDSISGCDIGRILYLYELQKSLFERDPCRAVVQWYSWSRNIPSKAFDCDTVAIDFDLEVIEEHRPYDSDISLETIYRKCVVLYARTENSASEVLQKFRGGAKKKSEGPMFVCRYKFIRVKNSYRLVPLEYTTAGEKPSTATTTAPTTDSSKNSRRRTCFANIEKTNASDKSESASQESKRSSSNFVNQRKRRASVACAADAIEFVDIGKAHKENKVSPIKIIGGRSIVKSSSTAKKLSKGISKSASKIEGNHLMASPLAEQNIKITPTSRAIAARRNLNLSLDNGFNSSNNDSGCLNYSIVENTSGCVGNSPGSEIKIKLRLSERYSSTHRITLEEDPLALTTENSENILLQRKRKCIGSTVENSSTPGDIYSTPSKQQSTTSIPSRRKSILKSATRKIDEGTPKRSIQLSNIVEKRVFHEDEIISTPKRQRSSRTLRKIDDDPDFMLDEVLPKTPSRRSATKRQLSSPPKTPSSGSKLKLLRSGEITPGIEERRGKISRGHKTDLQLARESLHVSVVPKSLPCREKEFDNIYTFLEGKIQDQCGGCMYVSGVPGTGKTATVTAVIRSLQHEASNESLPEFEFLEINGMRLTEPRQAYVQIYKQLTGKTVTWEHAHALLEKRFTTPAPRRITTVLLVDELDILCNRRQDVVYNLLDWPTKSAARLVVITIANTMDLPERLLMGKVTSRLGLTRLTFQPYTHKQLQEIVLARLGGSEAFKSDAVQLAARKVAAVSGDARRALDICRRATEIAEMNTDDTALVSVMDVQQALAEMIASPKVQAIKNCSRVEQMFLQAVVAEVTRTGVEETTFIGVYTQIESIAAFMGVAVPVPGRALQICSKLGAQRLLICEHSRNDLYQKILLNVSTDDVYFALRIATND